MCVHMQKWVSLKSKLSCESYLVHYNSEIMSKYKQSFQIRLLHPSHEYLDKCYWTAKPECSCRKYFCQPFNSSTYTLCNVEEAFVCGGNVFFWEGEVPGFPPSVSNTGVCVCILYTSVGCQLQTRTFAHAISSCPGRTMAEYYQNQPCSLNFLLNDNLLYKWIHPKIKSFL